MKRLVYIFSILLAVAVSCTEKETVAEVTLEYAAGQAAEVVAAPQGESITLGFVASDVWDVTTVADWFNIDRISGQAGDIKLAVTTDENIELTGEREDKIIIHCSTKELVFVVKQVLSEKVELLSDKEISLAPLGASAKISFLATKDWTVTTEAEWLTLSASAGEAAYSNEITVSAPVNVVADREATVTISAGEAKATVTVSQALAPETLVYVNEGEEAGVVYLYSTAGEGAMAFIALEDWTATVEDSWVTIEKTTGEAGTYAVKVTAEDNDAEEPREAVVILNSASGKSTLEFTIVQNNHYEDYCGAWTMSGTSKSSQGNAAYSEPWEIVEYNDLFGAGGLFGYIGESEDYASVEWDSSVSMIKIDTYVETGAVGAYNFNGIGPCAIAPIYIQYVGGKSLAFFSTMEEDELEEFPIYLAISKDHNSLSALAFGYDAYPPTKYVPITSANFGITYGLYPLILNDAGQITGFDEWNGYNYGSPVVISSIKRATGAASAAPKKAPALKEIGTIGNKQNMAIRDAEGNVSFVSAERIDVNLPKVLK
ncbi:MAG: BACON domain-containing protein [Candidatus Cryptobacteroides sp.]